MARLTLATYALLAVLLFAGAAFLWIRRYCAQLRGKRLPPLRIV